MVEEKEKEKDVREIEAWVRSLQFLKRMLLDANSIDADSSAGAKNLKELVVSIKIKLNQEGEVVFSKNNK